MSIRKISKTVKNRIKQENFRFVKQKIPDTSKMRQLIHLIKKQEDGACIIYGGEALTDEIYQKVKKIFPGQVVMRRSQPNQSKFDEKLFLSGKRRVMVAASTPRKDVTKLDIRLIIHFGLPISIIDYIRQIAQAGSKAKCVLLYSELDFYNNKEYLKIKRDQQDSFDYWSAFQELAWMYDYAQTDISFKQFLLDADMI